MRIRRSWNVAVVLVALLLVVTLQVAGAAQAPGTISDVAIPNTTALDPHGGGAEWATFVALVFLAVANLVALGTRQPRRRPDVEKPSTPWQRLIAARY